ncbi:MAG: hypothetical protein Q7R54_01565 [bacterium]|nr:hypothetical protein [bacterium]
MDEHRVLPTAGTAAAKRLARGNARLPFRSIVLRTLYGAGIISSALLAPKMLKLFATFDRRKNTEKRVRARVSQALSRLNAAGYIEIEIHGHKKQVRLTESGEKEIEKILLRTYQIPESAFWDGKWRVAIFDIREKRKRTRDLLRHLLGSAGFVRLQDSVWVYPYPCEEFIQLLRAHLRSGNNELIALTADGLTADKILREHFRLNLF